MSKEIKQLNLKLLKIYHVGQTGYVILRSDMDFSCLMKVTSCCWKSFKEDTTADSTTEAEYIAAAEAVSGGSERFPANSGEIDGGHQLQCGRGIRATSKDPSIARFDDDLQNSQL
ncbi:unnamed protein product [Cuscuta campestris]|uniref:Uncharacterized protein n=1 Tax=Cuscuta campestris TaxID=132261 RepID=A0A484L0T2_9ASTE|nr:unnamed protein product [Cuscuta campestris]